MCGPLKFLRYKRSSYSRESRLTRLHVQFLILKIHLSIKEVDEVVEDFAVDVAECEFVLGILADEGDPLATCGDIVLMDACYNLVGQVGDALLVEDDTIAP